MLSDTDRQALLDLCDKFIQSDDSINLANLIDAVNVTIPDQTSQDWKEWSKHMDQLNEAWTRIVKENEAIPWPVVSVM
jgi:flagellar biosynthesis chaperone FliJ